MCIEESIHVSDFFRAYGRTFHFQKQSYLVSYCVYTAATIELQQIEDPRDGELAAANDRLSTILRMLETEARQTPGIQRSIEIIKSRLGSSERIPGKPSVQQQLELPPIARTFYDQHSDEMDAATRLVPAMIENTSMPEVPGQGQYEISGQGMGHHGMQGPSEGAVRDVSATDQVPWMDWAGYNVSGGFVSDVTNWTFYDTIPDLN